jgi:hypothetical protein
MWPLWFALMIGAPTIDWNDGRADVAGYELVQPRYGDARHGTVVLIWVREDFSESARVKADPGVHPREDVFSVLKLNVVKAFQTGIYRYNLMTSAFTRFEGKGPPTKIVFSNQEWCGVVFQELLFDAKQIRSKRFSYFDREADAEEKLEQPSGGVTVDTMPTLVRSIHGELLKQGSSIELPVLPSLERTRLMHRKLAWHTGRLSRSIPSKRGIETWTLDVGDGDRYEWDVEVAEPRRLVEWRGPEGERGILRGSKRLQYWMLNREGDERVLSEIGLNPARP